MAAADPFKSAPRWKVLLPLAAAFSVAVVIMQVGLLDPVDGERGWTDLRARVLQDHVRLQHAVQQYAHDTGCLPPPSFDLGEGIATTLNDPRLVPLAQQDGWRGPYLGRGLARPTPSSFWSFAGTDALGGRQPGAPAVAWGRLHRGYGEVDDATASYVDSVLDDGDPAAGSVRVTDTWIWFRLAELPPDPLASGERAPAGPLAAKGSRSAVPPR